MPRQVVPIMNLWCRISVNGCLAVGIPLKHVEDVFAGMRGSPRATHGSNRVNPDSWSFAMESKDAAHGFEGVTQILIVQLLMAVLDDQLIEEAVVRK